MSIINDCLCCLNPIPIDELGNTCENCAMHCLKSGDCRPVRYNGTCEGCGMGFIRCTFELCPDCKSRIIPEEDDDK